MDESLYRVDNKGSASAGGCKLTAKHAVFWRFLFRAVKLPSDLIYNCEKLTFLSSRKEKMKHLGPKRNGHNCVHSDCDASQEVNFLWN